MPLADRAIKALKPKATRYKVFDGGALYLEVLPTGSKIGLIKYRAEGKDRRHTLGHYPAVSLHDALLALLNAKALLESVERLEPEIKAQNPTFSATAFERRERQAPLERGAQNHCHHAPAKICVPPHRGNQIQALTPQEILRVCHRECRHFSFNLFLLLSAILLQKEMDIEAAHHRHYISEKVWSFWNRSFLGMKE